MCLGQLRFAPSGQLLGIDLGVAMKIADAQGFPLDTTTELLQAAEAGLVEALSTEETEYGMIRDGIVVVIKGAVLPDGWTV